MTLQNEFELITLKTGIISLRSIKHGETFHPVTGPLVEANELYVKQQRLVERCSVPGKFVIWDVGFGAGANAIAAVEALQTSTADVELHSFDRSTSPIEFALEHSTELGYLAAHKTKLTTLIQDRSVELHSRMKWFLHLGDFQEGVNTLSLPAPHAIFYDPYSVRGNREMWHLDHFKKLRARLEEQTPCLLSNYTRSTAVRVTLLMAGFFVGVGTEVGEKAETTVASNHLSLLGRPLDRKWLERVRRSTHAAPLRLDDSLPRLISEEDFQLVAQHPQFCL